MREFGVPGIGTKKSIYTPCYDLYTMMHAFYCCLAMHSQCPGILTTQISYETKSATSSSSLLLI